MPKPTKLRDVCDHYLYSPKFLNLKGRTQKEYESCLAKIVKTRLQDGRLLGDVRIKNIHVSHLSECYEQWLESGVTTANRRLAVLSVCWKYARQKEWVVADLIPLIDRVAPKPRKVKWERHHVTAFLDVAYSSFQYRSVGLIVHMAYEWAQRIGDMRMLTWDKLDLDAQRLDLTQSKRSADVHLPIGDNLNAMLVKQKEDFGFQDYVAPHTSPRAGTYSPYKLEEMFIHINKIKGKANLPKELTAMDLRRTAVTEMLEGGVDMAGIMQVTGHRNPSSVTPYMVNTYRGASAALAARGGQKDE